MGELSSFWPEVPAGPVPPYSECWLGPVIVLYLGRGADMMGSGAEWQNYWQEAGWHQCGGVRAEFEGRCVQRLLWLHSTLTCHS